MSEVEILPQVDLGEPSQELLDYAKEELGENPETRCQVLEEFRDLIFERGECTPPRTDDEFLLRFLRARYFVVRHAHRLLVNYCQFRENNPQFFKNVDLTVVKKIGDADLVSPLPYRDQMGRRTMLYRFGVWDPKKVPSDEIFQATMVILELAMLEQKSQILGGNCIFDCGGITMGQTLHVTPTMATQIFQLMVTSFPLRIHSVHIVNQPWIFHVVFALFKPFLNDKMKERLFIHGNDMESLHKHLNPKHLPKRYGGAQPDYSYNDWLDSLKTNDIIIRELGNLGYTVDTKTIEEFEKK